MPIRSLLRRRSVLALLGVGAVALVVALALFQPWKLVVDETVDEAAPPGIEHLTPAALPPSSAPSGSAAPPGPATPSGPAVRSGSATQSRSAGSSGSAASGSATAGSAASGSGASGAAAPGQPAGSGGARLLAAGTFVSHEHESSGRVRVIALPDGRRILRLDDLATSNGPDLHVWITDAPVRPGRDGWFVFDDGTHVDLGRLKGNRGSQNYDLPASADLTTLTSVTIWCDRFNVSFAAAPLTPL